MFFEGPGVSCGARDVGQEIPKKRFQKFSDLTPNTHGRLLGQDMSASETWETASARRGVGCWDDHCLSAKSGSFASHDSLDAVSSGNNALAHLPER